MISGSIPGCLPSDFRPPTCDFPLRTNTNPASEAGHVREGEGVWVREAAAWGGLTVFLLLSTSPFSGRIQPPGVSTEAPSLTLRAFVDQVHRGGHHPGTRTPP